MDTKIRTLVKAISYRIVAALTVFILSILMDYGAGFGIKFVIITMTIGLALFYIHERVWAHINWLKEDIYDTKARSIVKTISWRIMSFIALFIVGYLLGLSSNDALVWTIVNNIAFITIHYLHERVWNRILWGRLSQSESSTQTLTTT